MNCVSVNPQTSRRGLSLESSDGDLGGGSIFKESVELALISFGGGKMGVPVVVGRVVLYPKSDQRKLNIFSLLSIYHHFLLAPTQNLVKENISSKFRNGHLITSKS